MAPMDRMIIYSISRSGEGVSVRSEESEILKVLCVGVLVGAWVIYKVLPLVSILSLLLARVSWPGISMGHSRSAAEKR